MKPSGIREFFDIVSTMPDALSLGVGEPDFVTPWYIRDAAIKSIQKGYTAYTSNRGLMSLCKEICAYLKERFGVEYDPEHEVLVTMGASEAIDLALRALIEPGDAVLVPSPSYVSYMPITSVCGGRVIPVECPEEHGFKLTPEALERAASKGGARVLIMPYPNNPTGAVMTREEIAALLPVIEKYDLAVVSDEIYAELTYDGAHASVPSVEGFRDRTVLINGFSKAFAMTGWRIGFVCAPPAIDEALFKIHQYVIMCAPTASQYAALEGLTDGFTDGFAVVESMRDEYDKRRRFMVDFFNGCGLSCFEPRGAFYVYPSVESTGLSGEAFANELLRAEKVAVVPGDAFGEAGKDHVRCSYATSLANLREAAARIEKYAKSVRR